MKKIAVIGMSNNPGGVESYLINFLKAVRSDYKVVFVNLDAEKSVAHECLITELGGQIFDLKGNLSLKGYFHRKTTAVQILNEIGADIVYVNALTTNWSFWVRAAHELGIQCVYHSHNAAEVSSSSLKMLISRLIRPLNRVTLRGAMRLAASEDAGYFMFGSKSKFTVVYNAVDPVKWKFDTHKRFKFRKYLKLPSNVHVILSVARLDIQKNSIRLIQILNKVVKNNSNVVCLLVGDGPLKADVQSKIAELGLESKVLLLGNRSDVPDIMAAADLFVLPSLFEGLPFVVVEAQAAGLPIVASNNAVPTIADITGEVTRLDLSDKDGVWAEEISHILMTEKVDRLAMNHSVKESAFSLKNYEFQIDSIFARL